MVQPPMMRIRRIIDKAGTGHRPRSRIRIIAMNERNNRSGHALEDIVAIRSMPRSVMLAGLLFAAVFLLWPSFVKAVCPQWDVSGKWNIEQENPPAHVELDLTQDGTSVTGTAKLNGADGKVKGTVVGDEFGVEIQIANAKHVFRGSIGPARIAGVSSLSGASEPTVWYSTSAMKCAEAAPKSAAAAPSATSTSAAGRIWANPSYATVPAGQTEGSSTLAWDAGGDHPNAEVWLKIDEESETLVVKQGKGSRQVQMKPNKIYLYILKDAGGQLDSVTVMAVD